MANIIRLKYDDTSELELVRKSLIGLRQCYPEFNDWYNTKVVPKLKTGTRKVFLATHDLEFSGALILKDDGNEKKVCTLFVNPKNRFRHIGSDFLRIASEELETYKLPITISDEAKPFFYNNLGFNFYTKEIKPDMYKEGVNEYLGYILWHNPDKELRKSKENK